MFTVKRSGNKQQHFILITIILILLQTILLGYFSVFSLYLYGRPLCLDALHVSILSSVRAVVTFLLSLIAARVKMSFDRTYLWAVLGSLAVIADLIILSLTKTIWLLYIGLMIPISYTISYISLLLLHFCSCFNRKFIFYYATSASNKTNQNDRAKRVCYRIYWCRRRGNAWSFGSERCS